MKGTVALVALQGATLAFDKLYTYIIPPDLLGKAQKGCRVLVPFGKGNIKKQGMIFGISEAELKGLKSVYSLIDSTPILNEEMLSVCEYLRDSTFCTYYDGIHAVLPAGLTHRLVNYYSANREFAAVSLLNDTEKDIYLYLSNNTEKSDSDIVKIDSRHENKVFSTAVIDPADNQILSVEDIQKPQLVITTYHRNNPDVPFNFFAEESDGTQRLFNMMLTILDIVKNNKILLIDEIETQLHIKLVEYIIGLFNKSESAQLIYTTHNTYLLNTNKLRKDQIYFVNKRDDGSSDLYSLFDYKDFRDGLDAEKAYLQGRFDAIPYIDEQADSFIK